MKPKNRDERLQFADGVKPRIVIFDTIDQEKKMLSKTAAMMDILWKQEKKQRPDYVGSRLRALEALAALGIRPH